MKQILFVDDEQNVLDGLRRMLHCLKNEWEMEFVAGGRKGLDMLARQPCDVVLADIRMPDMDGGEFLGEVLKRHPHVVRIALSGQSDEEAVLRSVGTAHVFISKPCDAEVLKATVARACALRELLGVEKLRRATARMNVLPSTPEHYAKLISKLQCAGTSITSVAGIMAADVAMAAKMLQLVNSGFFGLNTRVSSIKQAVELLGLRTIKALILSAHVFSKFDTAAQGRFGSRDLDTHSVVTGAYASLIAHYEHFDRKVVQDTHMAGLLHDTGKLVLSDAQPEQYAAAVRMAHERRAPIWQAEMDVFGASHAEVGGYLLGLWGLPEPIVDAISFHHRPAQARANSLGPLAVVHAADALEYDRRPVGDDMPPPVIDIDYLSGLHLDARLDDWRNICRQHKQEGKN